MVGITMTPAQVKQQLLLTLQSRINAESQRSANMITEQEYQRRMRIAYAVEKTVKRSQSNIIYLPHSR